MSMYTQLLNVALEGRDESDGKSATGEMLAEFLRCRGRLEADGSSNGRTSRAPKAISDQLAYDIALIGLCDCLEIRWDIDAFDRPETGRTRLEGELANRGIDLEKLDRTAL